MIRFLRAIGIDDEEWGEGSVLSSTQDLIDYRWQLVRDRSRFHCAVAAVMIASESQILEEMVAIEHGHLSRLYGFQHDDLAFYNVRAGEDIFHVRDGLDLVAELCKTDVQKQQAIDTIHQTCRLYWRYYDGIVEANMGTLQAQCV
jgi:pyrroloquinoline-quinone synthase